MLCDCKISGDYFIRLFYFLKKKGLKFIHTSFYAKTSRSRLVTMFRFYWRLREPPTTSRGICERCKFRASTEVFRFSCSCISLPPDLFSFPRKHAVAFGERLESTSFGIFPNGRTKVASAVRTGGLFRNKREFVTVNASSLVYINNCKFQL